MAAFQNDDSSGQATPKSAETRKDAAATLGAVSSAVNPAKTGIGQKLAIAGTVYRLARRYPVPTLLVGGVVLAIYMSRRHAFQRVTRH